MQSLSGLGRPLYPDVILRGWVSEVGVHNAGYGRCEPTRRVVGCVGFRFRLHLNGGHVEKAVGFGFGDFVGDGASRIGSLGGTACHGGCLPFQLSG